MKKLLILLLLTFGLIGNSYSESSGNADVAKNALRCAAFFYIQTAIPDNSENASMAGQIFNRIYGIHYEEYSGENLTYGDISDMRGKVVKEIAIDFSNESEGEYNLAKEFRHCAYWLQDIAIYLSSIETNFPEINTAESAIDEEQIFLSVPIKSSTTEFTNEIALWDDQVNWGFQFWLEAGSPLSFSDQLDGIIDP